MKQEIKQLQQAIRNAKTILIGAGAGLSTAAGMTYSGERFHQLFGDFEKKYGITDMYSGGFYPFKTQEEFWGWWSRHIWCNRYQDAPKPVYQQLLALVRDKDYFVLTTNVDHQFQRAGFDKRRMFYTQGDYGLFQCSKPCHRETYDNEETVRAMILSQGFEIAPDNALRAPEGTTPRMAVSSGLLPRCPKCGRPMTTNLRSDDRFVEDQGWEAAARRYSDFLDAHEEDDMLLLELGVGMNTPTIIKVPFLRMAMSHPRMTYACVSMGDIYIPDEIQQTAIAIEGDFAAVLEEIIKE